MLLPNKKGKEITTTDRSLHEGRHLDSYSEELWGKMEEKLNEGLRLNWTSQQYQIALEKIMQSERKLLKDGKRNLYKDKKEK